VEAAGIEPASEKVRTRASTRLADSLFISPANHWTANGRPASPKVSSASYGHLRQTIPSLRRLVGPPREGLPGKRRGQL